MKKYFVGVDESYDVKIKGIFVLCFFVIKNEKDYTFLIKIIENILTSLGVAEIKNKQISDQIREKYFKKLKNIDYEYYIYSEEIKSHKDIKIYYENGLKKFTTFISKKANLEEKLYLDIKLDTVGGETLHKKYLDIFKQTFKNTKIKYIAKYENSRSSLIIQYADLFAGENRKLSNANIKNINILNKNKTLL